MTEPQTKIPITKLIAKLCPDGVEFKNICEIFEIRNGYTPSKAKSEFWEKGTIPWFVMEDIRKNGRILSDSIQHITPEAVKGKGLFKANSINMATSATIGEHALITVDHLCNQRFINLKVRDAYSDLMDIKFFFYYAFVIDEWCKKNTSLSSFATVDMAGFKKLTIPVPPMEVQREIVRILDKFTELIALLKKERIMREKQYEYYREKLLTFGDDVDRKLLGEVCHITTGKLNVNEKDENGQYPFFTCDEKPYRINKYAFDTTAILISGNGSQVGHINLYSGKFNAYQRTYVLSDFEGIDIKFLYQYLKGYLKSYIVSNSRKASIPYITLPMLSNFEIPLPPLSEQRRIAGILDRFDALCNDLSSGIPAEIAARKKQYEYYRDRLLTFKEKKFD